MSADVRGVFIAGPRSIAIKANCCTTLTLFLRYFAAAAVLLFLCGAASARGFRVHIHSHPPHRNLAKWWLDATR